MPSKPQSAKRAQTASNKLKRHLAAHETALKKSAAASDKLTAAVNAHAAAAAKLNVALDAHVGALDKATRAHAALTDAMSATRRALAAALPKSPQDKATDARNCVKSWLVDSKHVSPAKAGNPGTKLADLQMSTVDMGSCLEGVQQCVEGKGYQFTPDESFSNLSTLVNGTLGGVFAYVARNLKP